MMMTCRATCAISLKSRADGLGITILRVSHQIFFLYFLTLTKSGDDTGDTMEC